MGGGGACFPGKTASMLQNSKTANAITLKLGHFSQIDIRGVLNVIN